MLPVTESCKLLSWWMISNFVDFFQHEKQLHALANALLEYETLSAEEIKRILLPYREGQLPEPQEEQEEGDFVLA